MKTIKLYTGNCKPEQVYEGGLHPISQVAKVIKDLSKKREEYTIHTNSPHVVEAFSKYGTEKGYKVIAYFNGKKKEMDVVFDKFSKPFEKLIFG